MFSSRCSKLAACHVVLICLTIRIAASALNADASSQEHDKPDSVVAGKKQRLVVVITPGQLATSLAVRKGQPEL